MSSLQYDPGFNIIPTDDPIGFQYGEDVFGPDVEMRSLDSIRKSLRDPYCTGPEIVYAIAMDVGKKQHRTVLEQMHLLYGAVIYAEGSLGGEPIRSQGHIHKVASGSNWSTPEVYEIWRGKAIIYMQESTGVEPGRCFVIEALPGDVVIVPPGWVHATISADPSQPLIFGAWCVRNYGYEYDNVRRYGGIAWFPLIGKNREIIWEPNPNYQTSSLTVKSPADYAHLGIEEGLSIYSIFEKDPEAFLYVPEPQRMEKVWADFTP